MFDDITGIILAGGKSSRMGMEKPLVILGGRTALERMHELMRRVFSRVMIVAGEPGRYTFPGTPCVSDEYPGAGPAAGIHAGLLHSGTGKNFIIACDLPLMTEEMIGAIASYPSTHWVTVARAEGIIHYLCGVYHQACLPLAESLLAQHAARTESRPDEEAPPPRECSARSLCELAGMDVVDAEAFPFYRRDVFFNMNRPEDAERARVLFNPHSSLPAAPPPLQGW